MDWLVTIHNPSGRVTHCAHYNDLRKVAQLFGLDSAIDILPFMSHTHQRHEMIRKWGDWFTIKEG